MPEQEGTHEAAHEITVQAPAAAVYRLIAEVENWPVVFPPTVYVEPVERSAERERIRIWATANGEVKSWTSTRRLDPQGLRIEFRQEVSTPPVAGMGGAWVIEPITDTRSRVRLLHDYRAVDDAPASLAWIDSAVDRNSTSELAALKAEVERANDAATVGRLTFADTVQVAGSAKDIYEFLNDAQHWQERLPHVADVVLTETTPGVQVLQMNTRTKDGHTHITESIRVCFPDERIVYKQTTLPALMTAHTGSWHLKENAQGVAVTSQHVVVVNPEPIARILGDGAGLEDAATHIRTALSHNSRVTLEHAKRFAEGRN